MRPRLKIISKLGEGTFSDVYLAKDETNRRDVAVKILKAQSTIEQMNNLPELKSLLLVNHHENVITLYDHFLDKASLQPVLVFELMPFTLYEVLQTRMFEEEASVLLMFQLLRAIDYFHKAGYFHRDIKPENLLINENFELKLCDFGSATAGHSKLTEYVSTRWYRAPETMLTAGYYGPQIDIWAAGCIFCELLLGDPLFPGNNELDMINRIHEILGTPKESTLKQFRPHQNQHISFRFPTKQKKNLASIFPNVSKDCLSLIESILQYDPRKRISAEEALKLPVFQKVRAAYTAWEKSGRAHPFPVFYSTFDGKLDRTDAPENATAPLKEPPKPSNASVKDSKKPEASPQPAPSVDFEDVRSTTTAQTVPVFSQAARSSKSKKKSKKENHSKARILNQEKSNSLTKTSRNNNMNSNMGSPRLPTKGVAVSSSRAPSVNKKHNKMVMPSVSHAKRSQSFHQQGSSSRRIPSISSTSSTSKKYSLGPKIKVVVN